MEKINFGKLAAILLLVGALLLAASLRTEWKEGRMFRGAEVTQGQVVDRYTTAGSEGAPGMELAVRFVDGQRHTHEVKKSVEEDYWNQHPRGSRVGVRFLPSSPQQAWLVGSTSGDRWGMRKVIGSAFILLLGFVAIWLHREYK